MTEALRESGVPGLHVLVPDEVAARDDFRHVAGALRDALAGELALHLRLRETPAREIHALAVELSDAARRGGGWCVVNGRVDVALTAGAQAVQLGEDALPLPEARELVGPDVAVGRSVHGLREAEAAAAGGANYLVLGTIYATPSHPGRAGAGPELVARAAHLRLPIVAIGGVTAGRVRELREAGAHGIAVIRAVWAAGDPVAAASELASEL